MKLRSLKQASQSALKRSLSRAECTVEVSYNSLPCNLVYRALDHCGRSCPFWLYLTQKIERGSNYVDGVKVEVVEGLVNNRSLPLKPG